MKVVTSLNLFQIFDLIGRAVSLGVFLVEQPGNGEEKKQAVIDMVLSLMDEFDICIPLPDSVFEFVLDFLVDSVVDILNNTIWKEEATA